MKATAAAKVQIVQAAEPNDLIVLHYTILNISALLPEKGLERGEGRIGWKSLSVRTRDVGIE